MRSSYKTSYRAYKSSWLLHLLIILLFSSHEKLQRGGIAVVVQCFAVKYNNLNHRYGHGYEYGHKNTSWKKSESAFRRNGSFNVNLDAMRMRSIRTVRGGSADNTDTETENMNTESTNTENIGANASANANANNHANKEDGEDGSSEQIDIPREILETSAENIYVDNAQEQVQEQVQEVQQQQQPPIPVPIPSEPVAQSQEISSPPTKTQSTTQTQTTIQAFPCFDTLDRKLIKIALPCIANFAINPLVGAVDLFWINRMGNTLAVAGQAAANQIFSSAFWLTSFLPSVTATLVAKESAKGNEDGVQDSVCQAMILGTVIAIFGSILVLSKPDGLLSGVLTPGAPAREFARPYLMIRGFGFLPSMYTLIGFSSFRGVMDTVTPLKISLFANLMNAVLDPVLIFTAGMGVTGAALATLGSELTSAALFVTLLFRRNMLSAQKLFRLPKLERLMPLLKGGAALQLRNFALNLTFLAVTRVTQSIDQTGVAAAAHAMAIQTFQIGGIVLLALSTVAQFLVPGEMVEKVDDTTGAVTGGPLAAKATVNRLMAWGLILGTTLGALQVAILPSLLKGTPVEEVRRAAKIPALLGSVYQCFNGLVFIGEGVMVGTGSFFQLSISTLVATMGTLFALKVLPPKFGLTGVWMGFGVFNTLRLLGVFIHQVYIGPLSRRTIANVSANTGVGNGNGNSSNDAGATTAMINKNK